MNQSPKTSDSAEAWVRVATYVNGGGSAEERAETARWIAAEPRRVAAVEQLREGWAMSQVTDVVGVGSSAVAIDIDVIAAWEALGRRIGGTSSVLGAESVVRRNGVFWGRRPALGVWPMRRTPWSASAAFILGIVVTMLGWTTMHYVGHTAIRSSLTYTTGNGERSTVTLPDGGTVALNVASRLEVPTDYLTGNHTVRLVGEALFTIVHHAGTPLTVSVGGETVRVLGTSFLVRKYPGDSIVTVAVRDGKVSVRSVALTANQRIGIGRMGPGSVQVTDPAQFSFATGILTLDNVSLPAAVAELDRWYDVDIRLGTPKLAMLHIAGEFGPGSVAELAENLGNAYQVRVVRNGRVLTLYPR